MMIIRWITGFFKTLVNLWDWQEWSYYTKTGFDPKMPASQRWEAFVKVSDKVPETEAEEVMPVKNRRVFLKDKYGQAADEMIYGSTDDYKVDAVMEQYEKELRSRTAGNFYATMIVNRNLDYFHNTRPPDDPMSEALDADRKYREEQARRNREQ
ncbi:MAG: hypothetical protein H7A35_03285 [Planctomycetales bacterium]|nr:hypothetical protein [bacterium]UNM09078.1 MAG: hypothetical protein H7A35_03285 [Planctomycetales bacterium]